MLKAKSQPSVRSLLGDRAWSVPSGARSNVPAGVKAVQVETAAMTDVVLSNRLREEVASSVSLSDAAAASEAAAADGAAKPSLREKGGAKTTATAIAISAAPIARRGGAPSTLEQTRKKY